MSETATGSGRAMPPPAQIRHRRESIMMLPFVRDERASLPRPLRRPLAPEASLAGVPAALRERKPDIAIGLADPPGAALFSYYTTGELKAEGSSITEGIGQGRITANLEGLSVDHAFQVPDAESVPVCFDLLEHEGLCMGPSSGVNVAGAIRLARELGPGHTIVTILADYGNRYQSKLFNPAFLKEKGLPTPPWLTQKREAIKVPYE